MSERAQLAGTQSLERAIALLRLVAGHAGRGARLIDLTQHSRLSKPTVHRLLRGLERQGLVEQDRLSERYHLGPEAFVIGSLAADRYGVHRAALPTLFRLAQASEDTAFLSVRRGWHVVCLHREEGPFPIRSHVLQAGDRHPLGVGAGSLAILATLPDDEIEEMIAACAAEFAEERYRSFTPDILRASVARTRAEGFAFNPGHLTTGSWGVGVAILDRQGRCEGALSIAAIDGRLGDARRPQIAALLAAEAKRVSELLARPSGATNIAATLRRPAAHTMRKQNHD